jgi:HlyD family secretion protein
VNTARAALARAEENLGRQQDALREIKETTALPTTAESALAAARADLAAARAALEHTRLRAPVAGTVLDVDARAGEMATPAPERPLVLLADLSALRVRAELDERDLGKVKVGQRAMVRANAFKDRTFSGTVRSIAQFVGPSRIGSRGPRTKLSDVDVVQVVVDLEDSKPLAVGMQVDVYFRAESSERTGSR